MSALHRAFIRFDRKTTFGKAVLGLADGDVVGAVVLSFVGVLGFLHPLMPALETLLTLGGAILVVAMFLTPCLALLGAPGWAILHRLGVRSQIAAFAYGIGLSATALLVLISVGSLRGNTQFYPEYGFMWAVTILVSGLIGWVIARVAYGKPTPPPAG